MMEENKTDETSPASSSPSADEGEEVSISPQEEDVVDVVVEAKAVALEMKKGLEERTKILEREEKLIARQEALRALGGGSSAGSRPEKHEETATEYKNRVLKGEIDKC